MVVPEAWADPRRFWSRLQDPVIVERVIRGHVLPIVVEPVRASFLYPCTVDDLAELLNLLPPADLKGIAFVALRQPTRKQALLSLAWGRLVYHAEVPGLSGPAVILEAQKSQGGARWPKSLQPWAAAELDLLRSEGHVVSNEPRCYRIVSDHSAMRATQLFRTVPHEVGHYVDYRQRVIEPSTNEREFNRRQESYWVRPEREREEFAGRYAREFRRDHTERLPFPLRFDEKSIKEDGLEPGWFQLPVTSA